jgi:hypothetical protein
MILRVLILVLAITPFTSVRPAQASQADKILHDASVICKKMGGEFHASERAITQVELTGDDLLETVVDARHYSCSSLRSAYCGSAGCQLTVIVGDQPFQLHAQDWKVVQWDETPVLLFQVHGMSCGGTNLNKCVSALVWDQDRFRGISSK